MVNEDIGELNEKKNVLREWRGENLGLCGDQTIGAESPTFEQEFC